jgi:hypothetical protein
MSNRWKGGFIQAYFDPLTEGPTTASLWLGRNDLGQIGDGHYKSIFSGPNRVRKYVGRSW